MQQNQSDANLYVQSQLQELIKIKVEEDFAVSVNSVQIIIDDQEKDKQQAYPAISSVQLILDKDKPGPKDETQKGSATIEPIEPVTINVNGESTQMTLEESSSLKLTSSQEQLLSEIRKHISSTWGIDLNKVEAKIEIREEG